MFTPAEIQPWICNQLPQLKNDLDTTRTLYQSIQVLTDYTKRMALAHDFKTVARCMALVTKIYNKGNTLVRDAVENVFVYSFSSMMSACNAVEWRITQSYMPSELYNIYMRQVLRSTC
jgi:hypothetical protein